MTTRVDGTPLARSFDSLELGEEFRTRARTVTEADVVAFSALTGDWHPQHADAVWAASSPFGERIAHGMLVLSFAFGQVEFDPDHVVALRRLGPATFKAPVRLGDTIHARGRIASLRPLDDATGLVETAIEVVNQHSNVVALATAVVIWRRDGPLPAE